MHKIIDELGNSFFQYHYKKESEFEAMITENAIEIFGKSGIYFNFKKLIGVPKKGATIPDGYFLDLTFHDNPKLYLVEAELHDHDVYGHIGEQILRFGISSETDKYKMKNLLIAEIEADKAKKQKVEDFFQQSQFNHLSELLDKVIFDKKPAAIIVIDEATEELDRVLNQLTIQTVVIEAETYVCGNRKLHRFTPLNEEVLTDLPEEDDADELDTIVVPAREKGFNEEFLGNQCWYAIRISGTMLDKIRYIAAYQVAPISGITHIAEVARISKYEDTNKYIVYFKNDTLHKIKKIGLSREKRQGPQAPRYTSMRKLKTAKTLDDLWS